MKKYRFNYKIFGLFILLLIAIAIVFVTKHQNTKVNEQVIDSTQTTETHNLCFYRGDKTDRGFYDIAWLKLNVTGEKVAGEFRHLPAESDSKVGKFEGQIGLLDQKNMSRSADVWWDSLAEGMEVKEELSIKWGNGNATVGFGEMIDRDDGIYVYKSKDNLYWIKPMNQMDCDYLDEKLFVEQYIRDNIGKIATNKAILGGTWYTISVSVNPSTKTGEVIYEDGHIQSKANFIYKYDKNSKDLTITKFELK